MLYNYLRRGNILLKSNFFFNNTIKRANTMRGYFFFLNEFFWEENLRFANEKQIFLSTTSLYDIIKMLYYNCKTA